MQGCLCRKRKNEFNFSDEIDYGWSSGQLVWTRRCQNTETPSYPSAFKTLDAAVNHDRWCSNTTKPLTLAADETGLQSTQRGVAHCFNISNRDFLVFVCIEESRLMIGLNAALFKYHGFKFNYRTRANKGCADYSKIIFLPLRLSHKNHIKIFFSMIS